jgi:DNA processing protein
VEQIPKISCAPALRAAFATAAILPPDLNTSSTIKAERPWISGGTINSSPKNIEHSIGLRDLASGLNSDFAVTLRFGILLYLATVAARRGPNETTLRSWPGTFGSPEYPHLLGHIRAAPPFLFYTGAADLLTAHGIGMCGSRNASDEGLRAAAACGEVATQHGLTVVSGYARGVDTTAHVSALSSGGSTVIVLPVGINHFRVKRGPVADVWNKERVLIVSQFPPGRPWSAGNAMARNNVIIGLSLALVVVEANEKGGTLAAGTKALQLNKPVLALEFAVNPRGNAELIRHGAISIRNRAELRARLMEVAENPQGNQLSII